MTTYPILPVVLPADLVGQPNGKLDLNLLVEVGRGGLLHHHAARAFTAMRAAAGEAGWNLTYTWGGTYRTYASQESLFRARYQLEPIPYRRYKTWNGVRWYQKPGVAMAAVPGKSNHGLGLAIDLALDSQPEDGLDPDDAVNIGPALTWLQVNAVAYGFSWEHISELWHVRYVAGDVEPVAVTAYYDGLNPPIGAQMREYVRVHADDTATLCRFGRFVWWLQTAADVTAVASLCVNTAEKATVLTEAERADLTFLGVQPHYAKASIAGSVRCSGAMFGRWA